ncbi:MAG: ComF family protein [Candidatus Levybacteria bacterium]|nr:ComF family protein [Candidatus Levybacteria bacterium]
MICLVCNKNSLDGLTHPSCKSRYAIDGAFSAVSYKGVVKKLLYNFKYKPYLSDLKNSLTELFYESIIQNEEFVRTIQQFNNKAIVLVPIPLHASRLRQRGYNHAEILAEILGKKLNLKVTDVLKRVKQTKTQFGLSLKQRKENISGAFMLNTKYLIDNANVFLVDDILTTGSTLLEAAKILKKSGVKRVWGLTFARD